MIRARGVYKRYRGFRSKDWVLRDVNFEIPKGMSVGLIGPNGAGKSTLLRLIGDMDTPDRGAIERKCRVSWPIGLRGGFQGAMTGRQNVTFVARVHGDDKDIPRVVSYVEEFAEIGRAFDMPLNTYSSGMRARLAFGMSLAFDFDVYLSDEATAVGDAAFKHKATKAFQDLMGKSSIIMVSHQEGILKELCQAGMLIRSGSAIWFDDVADALKAYHDGYNK